MPTISHPIAVGGLVWEDGAQLRDQLLAGIAGAAHAAAEIAHQAGFVARGVDGLMCPGGIERLALEITSIEDLYGAEGGPAVKGGCAATALLLAGVQLGAKDSDGFGALLGEESELLASK